MVKAKQGSKKQKSRGKKKIANFELKPYSTQKLLLPKFPRHKLRLFISKNKYWLSGALAVIVISLFWWLSQTWMVQSYFSQAKTYSGVTVLGKNVGGLDKNGLVQQLDKLKSEFETKKVTLVNGKNKWVFDLKKLGATFDVKSTNQSVLHLNGLSLLDKYRLTTGSISPMVMPTILVNNKDCVTELSVIPPTQVAPINASIYFEKGFKIKSDHSGTKFNAGLTCKEMPKRLAAGTYLFNVSLDIIPANLTKADLKPKLTVIQSMVGEPLTLNSGSYQQAFTTEQLFALISISKSGSEVKVDWLFDKLDEIVNGIAEKVNTYNGAPALGPCQYVSSSGGNWLDKAATKKIFTDLGAGKPRSYNLPIGSHAQVIGTRSPVAHGNSGTIYLTYDDGLTYGDRIMDIASCYGIKVTFFELGTRVGTDAIPLRRAIAEGHAVQSHGFEHAMYDYGQRSYDWQYNDISQSISAIMGVTGVRPTYFRPPGGNRSASTYAAASANGVNLILWGDASADATVGGLSSSTTCANVLAGAYPGASVLMHSTKSSTAEALPCIAEGLAAKGYNMQALR